MKQLLLFTILSIFSFSSFGQDTPKKVKLKKLITKENQFFLKGKSLSGYYKIKVNKYRTVYSNFNNGFREGKTIVYWDKYLESTQNFIKGIKHGKQIHYQYISEFISQELNFENGILDGWQLYYSNIKEGVLESKEFYTAGKKEKSLHYDWYGKLTKKCFFKKDESYCERYIDFHGFADHINAVDSIFYSSNKISKITTYVNDRLSFQMDLNYSEKKDSLTIIFHDYLKGYQEQYIFVSDIDLVLLTSLSNLSNFYVTQYSTVNEKVEHDYPKPCDIINNTSGIDFEFFDLYHIDQHGKKYKAAYYDADDYWGCVMEEI